VSDALKSWPRRLRALAIPFGILAASALLPGCSLLYDLSTSQCSVNAECASFGEGLVCGADHLCQIDTSGCATNLECLDRPDNIGESACIKEPGKARGECITLQTPDCPVLLPLQPNMADQELRSGDPIIFGAFTSVALNAFLFNYDLAVTEFQNKNGGIPTKSGGTRPVLVLACNGDAAADNSPDHNFAASLDRAMDQLIKLHVPGVLSSLEADDLKRVFETKGREANMFFMSSQESDSSLNALDDGGLVWEVLPGGSSLARAYKPVIDRTIAYLRTMGSLGSSDLARIAQVTTPDIRLLADISTTVQSDPPTGIVFNGMSVVQNLLAENYLGLTTPSTAADASADMSSQIDRLLEFKPHIIISAGSSEFLTKIIPALEQQWAARVPGQARPFYVLSPYQYNRSSLTNTVLPMYPTVQQRLIGINAPAAQDQSLYNSYISAFSSANYNLTSYTGYENFYDSAYYLLYAAAAARPTLSDGASMVEGMTWLLSGTSHNVGTADMPYALQDLARSKITLNGTMGPPNFSIDTGGRDDAGAVWCVDATKKTQPDVLRYQASDGTMQGTFPCFANY